LTEIAAGFIARVTTPPRGGLRDLGANLTDGSTSHRRSGLTARVGLGRFSAAVRIAVVGILHHSHLVDRILNYVRAAAV
jgi:hypothetical protein